MPATMVSTIIDNTVGASEDTQIAWPGDQRLDVPRPAILLGHGAGGQENAIDALREQVKRCVRHGYIVLSGDFGGQGNWGNDEAIGLVQDTIDHARSQGWANNDPVFTIGVSMGNTTLLNWARTALDDVRGHISVVGLWDLNALYEDGYYTNPQSIDNAYGGSWSEAEFGAQHNPMTYVDELWGLPMETWFSRGDELQLDDQEDAFALVHDNMTRHRIAGDPSHGVAIYSTPYSSLESSLIQLGG